jgi:hypothetical protein
MGSQGAGYMSEESTKSSTHRTRYTPLKAILWSHVHLGGEVAHKPILEIKGTRI